MSCSTLGCRLFPVLPACNPVSKPLRGGPDLTRRDGRVAGRWSLRCRRIPSEPVNDNGTLYGIN